MNRPASLVSLLAAAFLLPAASSFQVDARSGATSAVSASAPQQSASGVWALVGARIADGSGNEPFEGTIVVRDGRITEAGRSVQPPADARIVDAKGRTVTTGLIDLHVVIPTGASDDQIARALGAYVYAGVTTVAVSGIDPQSFDALREKLQAKGIPAPRLVAARADGASAVAPGLARASQSSQRKPTMLLGEMVSPSRFQAAQTAGDAFAHAGAAGAAPGAGAAAGAADAGAVGAIAAGAGAAGTATGESPAVGAAGNAGVADGASPAATGGASGTTTVAPAVSLAGVGAADATKWQAALDKLKTMRGSNVRLAIASGAGAADGVGMPHGWSTLLEARLLGEAGLTPLQAVTAATSGGAWALGLQSDRAFIAVGQRADLVVFNGQPTGTLADVEKIERVFLGGQEIDRAALRTFLTRDEPPPPAPPAPTENAATSASAGSATTGAGARGAAARKGRRGKGDPAGTSGATGAGGASASATPNPAAAPGTTGATGTAATTGSSGTAAGGTTAGTTTAATSGAAAGSTPTSGSPTGASTPGTASTSSGTSSSGTTSSATTSSATTPATGASSSESLAGAAAAAPLAGIALDSPLIDDFESNGSRANLGSAWQTAADPSTPQIAVIAGRVIRGLRDHALHLTARMGDASQPYAAVNVRIAGENGRPADVSRFRGVRFDARGEGRYRIVFITRGVTDGHYHVTYFSGSPIWTPVSVPFASIGQNGNGSGKHVAWTGRDLLEISFQVARDAGQMGWLELDNVRFY